MSFSFNSVNCHLPVQYTREYNELVTVKLFIHALANERRNHYGCGMHFYLSLACRIIISDPLPREKSEAKAFLSRVSQVFSLIDAMINKTRLLRDFERCFRNPKDHN